MTASEQEKVVRSYWNKVGYHETGLTDAGPCYITMDDDDYPTAGTTLFMEHGKTKEQVIAAAYAYTLDHKRKDAELEEEIEEMKFIVDVYEDNDEGPIFSRTLARLQSLLEQHMRGVRKDEV